MKRSLVLAAALAGAATTGWLARCELDRRRLAAPPRLDDSLRTALTEDAWLPKARWLPRAAAAIRAHMEPGETAEAVSVSARAEDGRLATYTMREGWVVPTVTFGAPERRRVAR